MLGNRTTHTSHHTLVRDSSPKSTTRDIEFCDRSDLAWFEAQTVWIELIQDFSKNTMEKAFDSPDLSNSGIDVPRSIRILALDSNKNGRR